MVFHVNEPCGKTGVVKIPDMRRSVRIHGEPKDLVEITVKEGSVPSHADQVPAHDGFEGLGVEGTGKLVHVLFEAASPVKKVLEPAYRHIGKRIEAVEGDVKP